MQRLVVSGGEAFVWGEPFRTARLIPRLERIAVEAPVRDLARDRLIGPTELDSTLARTWLARTNPDETHLLNGLRSLLETTHWGPLVGSPFTTWGIKEVVLTAGQLGLLMTLFPEASYVCIVRDPVAAYRSFRQFIVTGIAPTGHPDAGVSTVGGPVRFASLWREMAATFRTWDHLSNVLVLRYEDINGVESFPAVLGDWLDMQLDPDVWSSRVGETPRRAPSWWPDLETPVVRRLTRNESRRWGYG